MSTRHIQDRHSSFDGGTYGFLPCRGSVPTMPQFESNTPMRLQMGVYKVRALPLKMTASVWKLGNALCLCKVPLCTSRRLPLDLSKSLRAFKNLPKSFKFVNVFFFVVLPFTSAALYPLTDLDIVYDLLHRMETGFWCLARSNWLQFAEKKVIILLTTVHRAGMTVALRWEHKLAEGSHRHTLVSALSCWNFLKVKNQILAKIAKTEALAQTPTDLTS